MSNMIGAAEFHRALLQSQLFTASTPRCDQNGLYECPKCWLDRRRAGPDPSSAFPLAASLGKNPGRGSLFFKLCIAHIPACIRGLSNRQVGKTRCLRCRPPGPGPSVPKPPSPTMAEATGAGDSTLRASLPRPNSSHAISGNNGPTPEEIRDHVLLIQPCTRKERKVVRTNVYDFEEAGSRVSSW